MKRIISLLLALVMALSLVPTSVLAAGADVPAPSAENSYVDEIYFPVSVKKINGEYPGTDTRVCISARDD